MPDPRKLKVGDRIKFTHVPTEWSRKGFRIQDDDVVFFTRLIGRKYAIRTIDEYGNPWIALGFRNKGKHEHHTWAILEQSGWEMAKKNLPNKVMHRSRRRTSVQLGERRLRRPGDR